MGELQYPNLTQREREVMMYYVLGYRIKDIAHKLNISHYTVKTHLLGVYSKFDVANLPDLMVLSLKRGWITPNFLMDNYNFRGKTSFGYYYESPEKLGEGNVYSKSV